MQPDAPLTFRSFTLTPLSIGGFAKFRTWAEEAMRREASSRIQFLRLYDAISPFEIRDMADRMQARLESGEAEKALMGTTDGLVYLLYLHIAPTNPEITPDAVAEMVRPADLPALKASFDLLNANRNADLDADLADLIESSPAFHGDPAASEAPQPPRDPSPAPSPRKSPEERRREAVGDIATRLNVQPWEVAGLSDKLLRVMWLAAVPTATDANIGLLRAYLEKEFPPPAPAPAAAPAGSEATE